MTSISIPGACPHDQPIIYASLSVPDCLGPPNSAKLICARHWKFGNIVKIGSNLAKWFDELFVANVKRLDQPVIIQVLVLSTRYESRLPPASSLGMVGEENHDRR